MLLPRARLVYHQPQRFCEASLTVTSFAEYNASWWFARSSPRARNAMLRPLAGLLLALPLSLPLFAADWPQWRGPNRDGISKDTGLLQEWPKDGPKIRWKRTDIGLGYSTPV